MEQVLAQGWKITAQNIDSFLLYLNTNLTEIIASVSELSAKAKDERDEDVRQNRFNLRLLSDHSLLSLKLESEALIGHLFDESDNKKSPTSQTLLATPDISMVNILRIGLLALQLLPENSSAGIVVVTDGMLRFA